MDPETKAKLEEELNILEKEVINKEVKWDEDVKKLKTITKQLKQLNDNSDFDNAPSLSKKQRKSCKHLLLKCKIVFMQQSKDVFSILKDYLVNYIDNDKEKKLVNNPTNSTNTTNTNNSKTINTTDPTKPKISSKSTKVTNSTISNPTKSTNETTKSSDNSTSTILPVSNNIISKNKIDNKVIIKTGKKDNSNKRDLIINKVTESDADLFKQPGIELKSDDDYPKDDDQPKNNTKINKLKPNKKLEIGFLQKNLQSFLLKTLSKTKNNDVPAFPIPIPTNESKPDYPVKLLLPTKNSK